MSQSTPEHRYLDWPGRDSSRAAELMNPQRRWAQADPYARRQGARRDRRDHLVWQIEQRPTSGAPTHPGFAVSFEPSDRRVGQMRRITAAYLRTRALTDVIDSAALVVSELVTNAVRHGTGTVGLQVRPYADELLIAVSDGNPSPARLQRAADEDESGRGLLLVGALAKAWGVSGDGRTTWCALSLTNGRP